ncbi:uncharacterized protein LOC128324825 [Hemicordylus capensis]|uniref:uncharacterized protein LOC128324825 n=1 Tax=Hemicordylus capensis TaxID=884348 RepID=UPI00230280CB|nr:uncharacterized protein LOC128324825 [Hemicordylus capensis]
MPGTPHPSTSRARSASTPRTKSKTSTSTRPGSPHSKSKSSTSKDSGPSTLKTVSTSSSRECQVPSTSGSDPDADDAATASTTKRRRMIDLMRDTTPSPPSARHRPSSTPAHPSTPRPSTPSVSAPRARSLSPAPTPVPSSPPSTPTAPGPSSALSLHTPLLTTSSHVTPRYRSPPPTFDIEGDPQDAEIGLHPSTTQSLLSLLDSTVSTPSQATFRGFPASEEEPRPTSAPPAHPGSSLSAAQLQSPLPWHTCGFTHTPPPHVPGSGPAVSTSSQASLPTGTWEPRSSLPATLFLRTISASTNSPSIATRHSSTQTSKVVTSDSCVQTQPPLTRAMATQTTSLPSPPTPSERSHGTAPTSPAASPSEHYSSSDFESDPEREETIIEPPTDVAPTVYVSPNEEMKAYHRHVRAMADALGLDLRSALTTIDNPVYNFMLKSQSTAPVALPMLPVITRAAKCA